MNHSHPPDLCETMCHVPLFHKLVVNNNKSIVVAKLDDLGLHTIPVKYKIGKLKQEELAKKLIWSWELISNIRSLHRNLENYFFPYFKLFRTKVLYTGSSDCLPPLSSDQVMK